MKRLIYANSHHENGRYLQESIISARSFRQYIPDCEIVLYTDDRTFQHEVFDRIFYAEFIIPDSIKHQDHKNGQMLVKQQAMIDTTAEYNLVLGCDTLAVNEKVNSAFQLLERFDIAAVHAPTRIRKDVPDVPDAFPELNCDVIFFRKNDQTIELFKKWRKMYQDNVFDHPHDQGLFRYLIYNSDIKLNVLPFEYNNRMGLFGKQSSNEKLSLNQSVIIQNRDIIAEIMNKDRDIHDSLKIQIGKKQKIKRILSRILAN